MADPLNAFTPIFQLPGVTGQGGSVLGLPAVGLCQTSAPVGSYRNMRRLAEALSQSSVASMLPDVPIVIVFDWNAVPADGH